MILAEPRVSVSVIQISCALNVSQLTSMDGQFEMKMVCGNTLAEPVLKFGKRPK